MDRGAPGKQHGVASGAVLVLDDDGLSANHVGGAVQQQRSGHAAGQRAIDGLVLIVEGIQHHHLRRDRAGGFVDVVVERDMRVRIDDAGRQIFSAGVDHGRRRRRIHVLADGGDFAVLDIDAAVLDVAVSYGHHDGVLDYNFVVPGGGGCWAALLMANEEESEDQ